MSTSTHVEGYRIDHVGAIDKLTPPPSPSCMKITSTSAGGDSIKTTCTVTTLESSQLEDQIPKTILSQHLAIPSASTPAACASSLSSTDDDRLRKVAFGSVEIREYPIIVGDNPSTLTGVPICIDWEHVNEIVCSLDEYEEQKPESRTMVELRLPKIVRDDMLKRLGFSLKERQRGMKMANIGRNQRKKTEERSKLVPLQESLETMKRATVNATFGRSRKRREKELLGKYVNC